MTKAGVRKRSQEDGGPCGDGIGPWRQDTLPDHNTHPRHSPASLFLHSMRADLINRNKYAEY